MTYPDLRVELASSQIGRDVPAFTVCWACLPSCAREIYGAVNHRPRALVQLVPLSERPCSYCPGEKAGFPEA